MKHFFVAAKKMCLNHIRLCKIVCRFWWKWSRLGDETNGEETSFVELAKLCKYRSMGASMENIRDHQPSKNHSSMLYPSQCLGNHCAGALG